MAVRVVIMSLEDVTKSTNAVMVWMMFSWPVLEQSSLLDIRSKQYNRLMVLKGAGHETMGMRVEGHVKRPHLGTIS